MGSRTDWTSDLNAGRLKQFEFLTRQQPMTAEKLSGLLGVSMGITNLILAHVMPHVHVASWEWRKTRAFPMYAWGAGEDAPYPTDRDAMPAPKPLPPPVTTLTREQRIASAGYRKPDTVFRDWGVEMLFGPASVGLDKELKEMTP